MKRIALIALPAALMLASFGAHADGAGPIATGSPAGQTASAPAQPAPITQIGQSSTTPGV